MEEQSLQSPSTTTSTTTTPSEHVYKFKVSMSCGGCSGAVERVLKRLDGVKSYNVDLAAQTAEVNADEGLTYEAVLEKIKKTGKKVNAGTADGEERSV